MKTEAQKRANRNYMRSQRALDPEKLRLTRIKSVFNLSFAEYLALVEKQGGLCAICGRPERRVLNGKVKRLSIDHDHKTDTVRALLCGDCNTVLGLTDDNPERLEAAAAYLRQWSQWNQ